MKILSDIFLFSICLILLISGCMKQKPTNLNFAEDYFQLANIEIGKNNVSAQRKALALIKKGLACEKKQKPEHMATKARLLFNLGRVKESAECFKVALRLCKNNKIRSEILNNYACVLAQQEKYDSALKIWNKILDSNDYSTPEVALCNKSRVYIKLLKFKEAQNALRKAIKIEPDYIDSRYYLSLVCCSLNEKQEGKSLANQVLNLEPNHPGAEGLIKLFDIKRTV